ncbi:snapalysin [Streptomyces sp. NPDC059816]|uniref:snapalysin n=1 Tax=Streptomyces sp. NPDC059816 TaxID=3346960 RepID=UPI003649E7F0
MKPPTRFLSAALGLGIAAVTAAAATLPAAAADARAAEATGTASTTESIARYEGSKEDSAATKRFFEAVVKSVAEKRAANPGARLVTVRYNASSAPSFRGQIASSTAIWNGSVSNVRLQEVTGAADFTYREGNDPRGSYASTNMHGRGFIFLDYRQNQQYDSTRVTSHETGHVLGLYDNYRGPCSELMSGGGPGTSCRNAYPNAAERARVNQLWVNGFAKALEKAGATLGTAKNG